MNKKEIVKEFACCLNLQPVAKKELAVWSVNDLKEYLCYDGEIQEDEFEKALKFIKNFYVYNLVFC